MILFSACKKTVQQDINNMDLLITIESFPDEWIFGYSNNEKREQEYQLSESYNVFYRTINGLTANLGESVLQYKNKDKAHLSYQNIIEKESTNPLENKLTLLPLPKMIDLSSVKAEEWTFGCYSIRSGEKSCHFIGLYDKFIVIFRGIVEINNVEYISFDQLEKVILDLDAKIVSLVYKDDLNDNK